MDKAKTWIPCINKQTFYFFLHQLTPTYLHLLPESIPSKISHVNCPTTYCFQWYNDTELNVRIRLNLSALDLIRMESKYALFHGGEIGLRVVGLDRRGGGGGGSFRGVPGGQMENVFCRFGSAWMGFGHRQTPFYPGPRLEKRLCSKWMEGEREFFCGQMSSKRLLGGRGDGEDLAEIFIRDWNTFLLLRPVFVLPDTPVLVQHRIDSPRIQISFYLERGGSDSSIGFRGWPSPDFILSGRPRNVSNVPFYSWKNM